MGCTSSKAEAPTARAEVLPTILQSPALQHPELSKQISMQASRLTVPEPVWKSKHYNRQLGPLNLKVLSQSTSALEALGPGGAEQTRAYGADELLEALDPVFHHYYGIINLGASCPFMSAEEVVEYFKLAGALFQRMGPQDCEALGGASQIHALCEIFEFLDDKVVPVDNCDISFHGGSVRDLVNAFREISFPRWIKAQLSKSDTAAKACMVTGCKWGLEKTEAYQAALEKLLRNAEGNMNCRFDDANNCHITKATRIGNVVRIEFQYSGEKPGHEDLHDPCCSAIGWEENDGCKETVVDNVNIVENTRTSVVGSMEFRNIPAAVPDRELWFRFSGDGFNRAYIKTYLNFDHPDAKLLPRYWDRTILRPKLVNIGAGLSLRKSENVYKHVMGAEHQSEIGDNYMGYNMFCTQGLQQQELESFQKLFDCSFRKKFTRDRKDGAVPDRLLVTRGQRCQNVQNWVEYARRRWEIREELKADKGLTKTIDNVKTAGVLPMVDRFQVDSHANEELLFHGTNDSAAESITRGDFLVNLAGSNAGTLYGRGIYLAESVSKSDEYTMENHCGERCILVCRATLGYVNYTDQVAPNVDALVQSCVQGPFHCVLGDREKCRGTYREIIVYDDDQVYPEYIIWYKRVYEGQ